MIRYNTLLISILSFVASLFMPRKAWNSKSANTLTEKTRA